MTVARWLLDSDAATCICRYGLIEDLAQALGVGLESLCVLPQLRFQLHLRNPAKALKKLGSELAIAQASLLVSRAAEVSVMVSAANQALLEATPDIDGGELALFAALLDALDSGLITGDKRALVALSKLDGIGTEGQIWARLLCLEDAIARLIQHFGHAHVSNKVRQCPEANIALSIAFGRTTESTERSACEGLNSYINDVAAQTGNKYAPQHLLPIPSGHDDL